MKFWTSSRCISCGVVHEFTTPIPDVLVVREICQWCRGLMRPLHGYDDGWQEPARSIALDVIGDTET